MNQTLDTRESLLLEARKLFSQKGFDGTSVRAITRAAGANLGAVNYHFGSKEALYHAVLAGAWGEVAAAIGAEAARPGPPLARIEAVLRVLFAGLERQPDLAGLVLRELAATRPVPVPLAENVGRVALILRGLIAEGQAEGSIVPGDPQLLTLSLFAQPFHVLAVRKKLREVLGLPADEAAVFARVVDNAVAFVRRGLTAEGRLA